MEDKMASMQRKINPIRLLKWLRFQFFLIALILLIGFTFLFENNCFGQFGLFTMPEVEDRMYVLAVSVLTAAYG